MRRRRVLIIPSIQAASASFVGGSLYSEIGRTVYAIAGISRTNLEPYVNLNFDPNESWQLGAGAHFGRADSMAAFTVWDNRLHTDQQNTHVVVRHYFAGAHRLVLDASYKSGRGDTGDFVRGMPATGSKCPTSSKPSRFRDPASKPGSHPCSATPSERPSGGHNSNEQGDWCSTLTCR